MGIKKYDATVQLEGIYYGRRNWTGIESQASWAVDNENDNKRGEWTVNNTVTSPFYEWLEFRSQHDTYCMRYNKYDLNIVETDLETVITRGSNDKYELGVMFMYTNKSNYYAVTYQGGGVNFGGDNNFRLTRRKNGTQTVLGNVKLPAWAQQEQKRIKIYCKNGIVKVWVDDKLVFDLVDQYPLMSGAFGPIVRAQQFARFKFFRALSFSSFNLVEKDTGREVDTLHSSAENSQLMYDVSIGEYMLERLKKFLEESQAIEYSITKYSIVSSSPAVSVLFDRTPNKRQTTDGKSLAYAFAVPPTVPPQAPTQLIGTAINETSIKLTWSHDGVDTDGFYVFDRSGDLKGTVSSEKREFIETGLSEGTSYDRYIVSFNVAGNSTHSNVVIVTTLYYPPKEPSELRGVAISDSQIQWSWIDNSNNELSFELVDYSTGEEIIIATIAADSNSYLESGLLPLSTYSRYIRSRNPRTPSEVSNEATATTMEKMPNPPSYAPQNLKGVGTSHDTIYWSWLDKNLDADGFVFYDKEGTELFRIEYNTQYFEMSLLSENEYGRQIAAYNRGGVGPMSPIVYAKTQPYGNDTGMAPVAPTNLKVIEVGVHNAIVAWAYEENDLVPHEGFMIYTLEDVWVGTVDRNTRVFEYNNLVEDTQYGLYVKAYNGNGQSMSTNTVQFITDIRDTTYDFTEEIVEGLVDELDGVIYDKEEESTERIEAFRSGVGDGLDLLVQNIPDLIKPLESTELMLSMSGIYYEKEVDYQDVDVEVEYTSSDGTVNKKRTKVRGGDNPIVYRDTIDVDGLYPNSDDSNDSMRVLDKYGVEVSGETKAIITREEYSVLVGETEEIEMSNVFDSWRKFDHKGVAQNNDSEKIWEYNEELKAIMTNKNVERHLGAVSPTKYLSYDFTARLFSADGDDDAIGVVLAFHVDPSTGEEHTLTAMRRLDVSYEWSLYYNFGKRGAERLVAKEIIEDTAYRAWGDYYPKGTMIRAVRKEGVFEVYTSRFGSDEILEETKISLNLDTHPALKMFNEPSSIGVSVFSQEGAGIKIESFTGIEYKKKHRYLIEVYTNEKTERVVEKVWKSRERPLGFFDVKEHTIVEKTLAPMMYDADFVAAREKFDFDYNRFSLSITASNPNVKVSHEMDKVDMTNSKKELELKIACEIINPTQTSWYPFVHNGYYYVNHREYFIFSESDVLVAPEPMHESLRYRFPYEIKAITEEMEGEERSVIDISWDELKDFEIENGRINLAEECIEVDDVTKDFIITSKTMEFDRKIASIYIDAIIDNDQLYNTDVMEYQEEMWKREHEISMVDEMDNAIEWGEEIKGRVNKIKFRLILRGVRNMFEIEERKTFDISYFKDLSLVNATDDGFNLTIQEGENNATIVTKLMDTEKKPVNMSSLFVNMNIPEGTKVTVYTVTTNERTLDITVPSSNAVWIPAEFKKEMGGTYEYKIKSAAARYIGVIYVLEGAGDKAPSVSKGASVGLSVMKKIDRRRKLSNFSVGVTKEKGIKTKEHVFTMFADVMADGVYHELSKNTPEVDIQKRMSEIGIPLLEVGAIREYVYSVDSNIPVELDGDYLGKNILKGRTTKEVGEKVLVKKEVKVNEKGETLLSPVPQSGKPIVIRNAQGILMRQVHFLDEKFNVTLTNVEWTETNGSRYLFLQYPSSLIDIKSMKVLIEHEGKWSYLTGQVAENRIILSSKYKKGMRVKISYMLKDSYVVDYNYDKKNGLAMIKTHMSFDYSQEESKVLKVAYETNEEHAYYKATEVELNPLNNKSSSGFIYMSEKVYAPERMEIVCQRKMNRTKREESAVQIYVYDEYNNPVVDQLIAVEFTSGTLQMNTLVTDHNGMVYGTLIVSESSEDAIHLIASTIVDSNKMIEVRETVEVYSEEEEYLIWFTEGTMTARRGELYMFDVHIAGEDYRPIRTPGIKIVSEKIGWNMENGYSDENGDIMISFQVPSSITEDYINFDVEFGGVRSSLIIKIEE